MDILVKIFLWVLQASLVGSIASLVVILISKLFKSHIGVRFQNALMVLILLRLIIPVTVPTNIDLSNILSNKYDNKILNIGNKSYTKLFPDALTETKSYLKNQGKDDKAILDSSLENQGKSNKAISDSFLKNQGKNNKVILESILKNILKERVITNILNIASCVWLVVSFSIILFLSIIMWKFKMKKSNSQEIIDPKVVSLLEECKKKLSINRCIPIYACDDFKTPCICGILKPKIYIPKYKYSINDYKYLSHIFLHELIHYKRKDLINNFLGIIAIVIHWFNPIIWLTIKRMKLYREYACDTYVLEILDKEEHIEYGITLINFSKFISTNKTAVQLAICFETKNQIKRRIKMIKNFEKGSYRMSVAAVICYVLAGGIIFTNNVTAKNTKVNTDVETVTNKKSNRFVVDSYIKTYDNLKKAEKISGLKVKVPNYIPSNYAVKPEFEAVKSSDDEYSLKMIFTNDKNITFTFQASKVNMEAMLKKMAENTGKLPAPNKSKQKVQINKEPMNLGGINGTNITIKDTSIYVTGGLSEIGHYIEKYFVWENEGMWYSIGYSTELETTKGKESISIISTDEVKKIAGSIKYIKDIKNVNYSVHDEDNYTRDFDRLRIYDQEDFKKAKQILGFNPKFPFIINKDIAMDGAEVTIYNNPNEDKENIGSEISAGYVGKYLPLDFTQGKNSKEYEDIKKKNNPIKIDGREVFKYETHQVTEMDKRGNIDNYIWKENDTYCKVSIAEGNGNPDEIAKVFINSKPIN